MLLLPVFTPPLGRGIPFCPPDRIKADNSEYSAKRDFPGGAVVKNLPANAVDTGSSPGLGRSHMPRSN